MPRSQRRALQSLLRLFLYARAESLLIGQGSLEETEATEFKESHPMSSENPQMADWNGGIGSKQMRYRRHETLVMKVSTAHPLAPSNKFCRVLDAWH